MNTSAWNFYFKAFLGIALVGFLLVIASGFWHVLLALLVLAVAGWIWQCRRAVIK